MTRTEQKQRYNESHYRQIKVSVNPNVAEAFKAACVRRNQSQAEILTNAMIEYSNIEVDIKPDRQTGTSLYDTCRKRRKAIDIIIDQLENIRDAEQTYLDNIPENFTSRAETASESVTILDEVIDQLKTAY